MNYKENKEFYWDLKGFLTESVSGEPAKAPKKPSVQDAARSIMETNQPVKKNDVSVNITSQKSISQAISAMTRNEKGNTPECRAFTKNNDRGAFGVIHEDTSVFDDMYAVAQKAKAARGEASTIPMWARRSELGAFPAKSYDDMFSAAKQPGGLGKGEFSEIPAWARGNGGAVGSVDTKAYPPANPAYDPAIARATSTMGAMPSDAGAIPVKSGVDGTDGVPDLLRNPSAAKDAEGVAPFLLRKPKDGEGEIPFLLNRKPGDLDPAVSSQAPTQAASYNTSPNSTIPPQTATPTNTVSADNPQASYRQARIDFYKKRDLQNQQTAKERLAGLEAIKPDEVIKHSDPRGVYRDWEEKMSTHGKITLAANKMRLQNASSAMTDDKEIERMADSDTKEKFLSPEDRAARKERDFLAVENLKKAAREKMAVGKNDGRTARAGIDTEGPPDYLNVKTPALQASPSPTQQATKASTAPVSTFDASMTSGTPANPPAALKNDISTSINAMRKPSPSMAQRTQDAILNGGTSITPPAPNNTYNGVDDVHSRKSGRLNSDVRQKAQQAVQAGIVQPTGASVNPTF